MLRSSWGASNALFRRTLQTSIPPSRALNLDSLAKGLKTKPQVVNRNFQHAESASALVSEATRSLRHMNAFHLILFFNNLHAHRDSKEIVQHRQDEILSVVTKATASLDLFKKPVQMARLIYGICKLQLPKSEVRSFVYAWTQQARPKLPEFNEVELSNTILALGKLRCGREDVGLDFFVDWADCFRAVLPTCSSQALANSIHALAKLQIGPNEIGLEFFRLWADSACKIVDEFNEQGLSTSMYSLGRLGVGPDDIGAMFFDKWSARTLKRFEFFSEQGLCNSIYGLALLKVGPSMIGANWFLQWTREAELRKSLFTEQQMAINLYSLAQLYVGPDLIGKRWFKDWATNAQGRLREFTEQGLSNSIYSLGLLHLGPHTVGAEFFQQWAAAFVYRFDSFTEQNLANSIYAMGRLRLRSVLGDDFCISVAKAVEKRLHEFPTLGLSNVLSGMEMLSIGTDAVGVQWFQKWCQMAKLEEFNWKDLSRVIHSFAGLNIGPSVVGEAFFVAWSKAMLQPHIVFDSDIAHVVTGLRKLGVGYEMIGPQLGEKIMSQAHMEGFENNHAALENLGIKVKAKA